MRLTLGHPAGYFLSALTYPTSWAVPQALVEQYTTPLHYSYNDSNGTDSTWTKQLLDNGPFGGNLFLLTNWQHAQTAPDGIGRMTFERNERFWGKKPPLRRVEYTLYKDSRAEWPDFVSGRGDGAGLSNGYGGSDSSVIAQAQAQALSGITCRGFPA